MLHTNTIEKYTLELLKTISNDSVFNDFFLVGGTALALHIGHRKSIDLDFFSLSSFDLDKLSTHLIEKYKANIISKNTNSLTCWINKVKVDFITHKYILIENLEIINGIRLASIRDIAAMKLNAIKNRGTKKDFVDIYFLNKNYSFDEMLGFCQKKYPNYIELLILKNLIYFDDADIFPDCEMLIDVTWKEIKSDIIQKVKPLIK
jgi:hypothetical protein